MCKANAGPSSNSRCVHAGLITASDGRKRRKTSSPIEHVFHGTPPTNLDSILRSGMDPTLRRCGCDYFATAAGYSLHHTSPAGPTHNGHVSAEPPPSCYGPRKLLVFLVLTLPPGLNSKRKKGLFVLMDQVEYQLPIAEVTLRW